MSRPVVVVAPGEGDRVGNVEFLARTKDTPYFNLGIVVLAPGQGVGRHVHRAEDDSFLVVDGTLSVTIGEEGTAWEDEAVSDAEYKGAGEQAQPAR